MTLDAQSGRPISALGSGNPFDGESYQSFFICTANCDSETDAEYELLGRGSQGRTPWIFDVGLNVTWEHSFGPTDVHGEARGLQPAQPGTGARSG